MADAMADAMANGRWQEVELQQIGTYAITRPLSTGSTSSLYISIHRKKEIIIKVFHTPLITPEAKEAFLARAKQLKKLKHRYIVDIQDYGLTQDTQDSGKDYAYLVMQYVPDGTVRQKISPGECLRSDEVKRMLSPLASALHYAHVSNILHGNLHPGNLLVDTNNDILLTDFSLPLRSASPSPDDAVPALPYMAPEQLQGTLMAASDQYSLAVMVYEWLCGRRPYEATGREELLYQQEHEPLPTPGSLNAAISPAVERVLLQALAHNPDERFQHIQAFADNYLRALMGLPLNIEARHIGSTMPTSSPIISSVNTRAANKGIKGRAAEIKDQADKESKEIPVQSATSLSVKPATNDKTLQKSAEKSTNESFTEPPSDSRLLNQRYLVLDKVGQGGYGAVYKAQDTVLGNRTVALKEMTQEGLSTQEIAEATKAFKAEAELLAKLKHVSLPNVYDYFNNGQEWYFVMEFIEGETLEDYINKANDRKLPIQEVLYIGIQLCAVLNYLHTHNPPIIFRDLKPLNIMLNAKKQIFLIDFGIARHFKLGKAKDTTHIGTRGYAAPEQYGKGQTDSRSDIYSLGATLHQLLSGNDPSENLFHFESLKLSNYPFLSRLESLIMQMTDVDRNKRPKSIAIVMQELLNIGNLLSSGQSNALPQDRLSGGQISAFPGQLILGSYLNTINNATTENLTSHTSEVKSSIASGRHTPTKFPLPIGDTDLQADVSADLNQGGILSRSLPGYEERLAQVEMAKLVARSLTENTPAIIEASTGTGKALDVDTPIPTPTGWKRMGDLVVGDVVFDEKGQPTRVGAAFDVMYQRPCYEVVFSDGSSIVADAEHEWVSYTYADRIWASRTRTSTYAAKNFVTVDQLAMLDQLIALSENDDTLSINEAVVLIGGHQWSVCQAAGKIAPANSDKWPVRYPRQTLLSTVRGRLARDLGEQRRDGRAYTLITTERMAATLTVGSPARANHAVSVAGPLVLPEADLPIAPYFLGVWLGDGSCYNNQITTADPDLVTEIEKEGYTVRKLKSHPYQYAVDDENGKAVSRWQPGMTGRLRALGLRLNKHIPAIYLRASEQQRRALLAGLLDTDGTVNHCGAVEFTTTSPQLAQDVYELVCSLGFRPSLRSGRSRLREKDCGPKWTLAFTTEEQVFRLERKVTAHKKRLRNYSPERNRFRYVVAVREVPSRPVRCIQVESQSHLYLAGRSMIPTHNSLAYLVPIVRSGKVAIISTANKALQEQLFYKDIPFVQQHIKYFEAALVKGVGNYLCLDRLENERVGLQFYAKNREFTRLVDITNDPDSPFSGDFETLDFQLPGDIRSKVCADSDQCAWSKCNYFMDCYVHKMRDRAERAQVIIVNHTLLLLDAAIGGFLLPARDLIVLDEAHHLEEEATRAFTITISPNSITSLLAQRMLKDHGLLRLQDEANQALMNTWQRLQQVADPGYKGRANLQTPLEEGLRLATVIGDLGDSLRKQRPKNLPEKEEQLFDKLLKRTQNLAGNIRTVFAVDQPDKFVYYVERVTASGQRGFQLQVSAAPLDVTAWLKERLFDKCNVICTSATLATIGPNPVTPDEKGPNFAYFRRRTGLDPYERPEVIERILPLSFDYENNALLYLPRDLPAPVYGAGSDDYTKAIAREMYRLVKVSRGRAFLLFSSKRMLDQAYELMSPHLDFPLLRQGDMSRIELTRRFREEKGAVLFGLKSFWEGVDIAGDALSLVVIDKLPFDPPDDPVHEARVAQMKAAGENWFGIYVLPQAVLRLKQGLGRLLRTREDRGVMAILDTRLYTKGYGKLVLDALPPARRTASIKEVDRFFNEVPEPF